MEDSKKNTGILNVESSIKDEVILASPEAGVTGLLSELDASLLTPAIQLPVNKNRRSGHCIILYLPAILKPIQLWNQTRIVIGRNDNHLNPRLTLDLSKHHAALLGVSRIHAEITYSDSRYYVRDLDSKNGTWVNKTKLVLNQKLQLANHDTLRLAHFMIQVSSYQN